jgi:lipid-A-disaccharide synthase
VDGPQARGYNEDESMTIYCVAGEVSADNHGAALMRSLRVLDPELKFIGRGGPQMQQVAGSQFKNWIGDSAVLGLWEVLRKYGYFREQFRQTLSEIQESKPDAVVLIDYPGFNLRLARALRRQSQTQKTIYYISPQVWAWNRGRIKKMARFIDLMLCIFPFETDLYAASGLRAVFVGHPMIERLETQKIDTHRDQNLIGLFPGSRSREVRKMFPVMIEAARLLLDSNPALHFQVAAASEQLADEMRKMVAAHLNPLPSGRGEAKVEAESNESSLQTSASLTRKAKMQVAPNESSHQTPLSLSRGEGRVRGAKGPLLHAIEITVGQTAAIMQRAFVGIVASGSATLEAAYFGMPFVLIYKVAWPTYVAARLVVNVDFLGMPNLLASKEVVPEFIQHGAKPDAVVKAVRLLMEDSPARDRMISDFDTIIRKLGGTGASGRAARAILEELKEGRSPDRAGGLETAAPWRTR